MTTLETKVAPARLSAAHRWRRRLGSVGALTIGLLVIVAGHRLVTGRFTSDRALATATVFLSLVLQALPFLALGILVHRGITAFVPDRWLGSAQRYDLVAAVLASPAVSPVVIACTLVAFPGEPLLALGRVVAGSLVALAGASAWRWLIGSPPPRPFVAQRRPGLDGVPAYLEACRADLIRTGGGLVAGALAVAVLTTALPVGWLNTIAAYPAVAIGAAALFAVLLSPRSETDAVLAVAFAQFPFTARLAFLVVGPAVSLRRLARHAVYPGPQFAVRYGGIMLVIAALAAAAVGGILA